MKTIWVNYLIKLSALTFLLALTGYLLFSGPLNRYYLFIIPYMFGFFFIISLISFTLTVRKSQINPKRSIIVFMGGNTAKLFLSLLIMVAWAFFRTEEVVPFIVSFAALYFAFTIFEVIMLLRYFRVEQKSD